MTYTIMMYFSPADFAVRSNPEEQQAYWAGWAHYAKEIKEAGILRGGPALSCRRRLPL